MDKILKAEKILTILEKTYKDAKCELNFKTPFELLVAVELSAQCQDKIVNLVTSELFKKYKCINDYANAKIFDFSNQISKINYFNNKTKNIINAAKILIEKFDSKIPKNLDMLLTIPGIGRKSANLILGEIFAIPGVVVDTHVNRLSNRLGLVKTKNPKKIEFELMEIIPKNKWIKFCHCTIFHGRRCCMAQKPKCSVCQIKHYCEEIKTREYIF